MISEPEQQVSTINYPGDPLAIPVDEIHPVSALSPYGLSKQAVENYLKMYTRLYGLEYTVLRYANVYGPRQMAGGESGVIAILTERFFANQPLTTYGDGYQSRDFVFVKDVARANWLALDKGKNSVLNVSSQREVIINDLVDEFNKVTGERVEVKYLEERPGDLRRSVLSNNRAKEILEWTPQVDLKTGLAQLSYGIRR